MDSRAIKQRIDQTFRAAFILASFSAVRLPCSLGLNLLEAAGTALLDDATDDEDAEERYTRSEYLSS